MPRDAAVSGGPGTPGPAPLHGHPHLLGPAPLEIEMSAISAWKGETWPTARIQLGRFGEDLAAELAEDLGMRVVARNWRCAAGEIDLVLAAPDSSTRFVEVKTRSGRRFGSPVEAVTPAKLSRLRRLAAVWLEAHEGFVPCPAVDVVAVERLGRDSARLTWTWDVV